jgi:L-lactate dehydrogenase complex protein LldG
VVEGPLVSAAREAILARVREALRDVPAGELPDDVTVARDYRRAADDTREEIVDRFAERMADYKATVARVETSELGAALRRACEERGAQRLVVPGDLPAEWRPAAVELVVDEAFEPSELDGFDGVLTGCALGIAETATLVLDGGPRQGRRAITLVPDLHLCVIAEEQIVALVPEAIERLGEAVRAGRPLTFVSGPSATSDIELNRVEGVHGPRTLAVFIVRAR